MARDRGRAAFESPVLVGGSAGARGVSCSSCHISGRSNPDFFVEKLSGEPGTADVTSSLFSKVREDGVFNPKPIPDLAARDGNQIRDRSSAEFRAKLRGLIVEEFAGQPPPTSVFEDVRSYLDSLALSGCADPSAREPIRIEYDLAALATAIEAAAAGAAEGRLFWLNVARRRLERIDERFQGSGLGPARAAIDKLNRRLSAAQDQIRAGQSPEPISLQERSTLSKVLRVSAVESLYNPEILRAALAAEAR